MYRYRQTTFDQVKDNDGMPLSAKYFYGSPYVDQYLFKDPKSLPLYGNLARKLLRHYARDHYNPHTISITMEPFLRMLIKGCVEHKVFYRLKSYDWEFIDHFFRKVVGDYYKLDLGYDPAILERGCKAEGVLMTVDYKRPV